MENEELLAGNVLIFAFSGVYFKLDGSGKIISQQRFLLPRITTLK